MSKSSHRRWRQVAAVDGQKVGAISAIHSVNAVVPAPAVTCRLGALPVEEGAEQDHQSREASCRRQLDRGPGSAAGDTADVEHAIVAADEVAVKEALPDGRADALELLGAAGLVVPFVAVPDGPPAPLAVSIVTVTGSVTRRSTQRRSLTPAGRRW